MKHCSGRKIQNDTFSSNVAAVGRNSLDGPLYHTKENLINQVVCSDSKTSFRTSKTLSRTIVVLKQSGADWTEVFKVMI